MSVESTKDRDATSIFNPSFRAEQARLRYEMPPERYLADIRKYLHDAVGLCIAQDVRKPINFFSQYFQTVLAGENVLFRNFKYVNSTARNRRSFIRTFSQTFASFEEVKNSKGQSMTLVTLIALITF